MVAGIACRAAADPVGWALTDGTESLNWADLNVVMNRAVNAILGTDLGPDRRVAIMAQNSAQAAIAHLAAIYAGASAVPVNWQLRPVEASRILYDSAPRLVLASPQSESRGQAGLPARHGGRRLAGRVRRDRFAGRAGPQPFRLTGR